MYSFKEDLKRIYIYTYILKIVSEDVSRNFMKAYLVISRSDPILGLGQWPMNCRLTYFGFLR